MPSHHRRPRSGLAVTPAVALAGALVVVLVAAGCGGSAGATLGAPDPAGTAPSSLLPGTSASTPTTGPGGPSLTPVPGGQTVIPDAAPSRIPTTQTEWGTILDALPASFPLYPGAGIAEVPEGPLSGSFEAQGDVEAVVAWYEDQLAARGYGLERSDPLEDGGITLDGQADLPECRIRMVFRPEATSTIIAVVVASACATGTEG